MKTIKTIVFALFLFCVCCVGVTSAETHIPAGTVSSYSLNTAGETYILDGDVAATGTAFTVAANNVTLDGQGHTITYASDATGNAVYGTVLSNTTIKNVYCVQSNASVSNTHGIYLYNVPNSTVIGSSVTTQKGAAIFLRNSNNSVIRDSIGASQTNAGLMINGQNDTVTNSTFTSNNSYAVSLDPTSKLHTFTGCNISSISGSGIEFNSADDSNFTNCLISSGSGNGVTAYASANQNRFINCTFESNINQGIIFTDSTYNNFTKCRMLSNTSSSVRLTNASNNVFDSCNMSSISLYGVYSYNTSNNNTFSGCNIQSSSNYGAWVRGSLNNTFGNCNIVSNTGDFALLINLTLTNVQSNENVMDNCTIQTNSNGTAVYIQLSDANKIYNSSMLANSGIGVLMDGANQSIIKDSNAVSVSSYGLQTNNSSSNVFTNVTCTSQTLRGVRVGRMSANNTFKDMNIVSPQANSNPTAQTHILLVGDSITDGGTSGNGVVPFGAWGIKMSQDLNTLGSYSISNAANCGERANEAVLRFGGVLDIFNPDYVTIMYGTNDLNNGRPQQDIINDILTMAQTAQLKGVVPIILLTPPNGADNERWIYLNQNLSVQAHESGIKTIMLYDEIDAIPENGNYDAFVASNYIDDKHPNVASNDIIGAFMARNIYAITHPYYGVGLSSTYSTDGSIVNSRDVRSTDMCIKATFTPTATITVNISEWGTTGNCKKVWNESSETHDAVTQHTIGDFPANTRVQLNVDGVKQTEFVSDANGQIEFAYTGYSEHTFNAFVMSDSQMMTTDASHVWTGGIGILAVVVMIVISTFAIDVLRGKKVSLIDVRNISIALMVIMLTVIMGYGLLSVLSEV